MCELQLVQKLCLFALISVIGFSHCVVGLYLFVLSALVIYSCARLLNSCSLLMLVAPVVVSLFIYHWLILFNGLSLVISSEAPIF